MIFTFDNSYVSYGTAAVVWSFSGGSGPSASDITSTWDAKKLGNVWDAKKRGDVWEADDR